MTKFVEIIFFIDTEYFMFKYYNWYILIVDKNACDIMACQKLMEIQYVDYNIITYFIKHFQYRGNRILKFIYKFTKLVNFLNWCYDIYNNELCCTVENELLQ